MDKGRVGNNYELEHPFLSFEEGTHTYTFKGRNLNSVSKVIASYQKPFPYDIVLAATAKKHGIKPQDLADEWQQKNSDSVILGNYVHGMAEDIIFGRDIKSPKEALVDDVITVKNAQIYENAINSLKKSFINNGCTVFSELKLCHPGFNVAGTSDIVVLDKSKSKVRVMDFKTNRMKYKGKEFDKGNNKLLPPFDYLDDSKLNIYTMQINIYSYLLFSQYGYNVSDGRIIHFDDGEIELYDIPYNQDMAIQALKNFRANKE